jgi:hypothetical protein
VQRCNDGTIINRWHRHAYANHPLDLGTQHLLTATMPLSQESDARSLIFVRGRQGRIDEDRAGSR